MNKIKTTGRKKLQIRMKYLFHRSCRERESVSVLPVEKVEQWRNQVAEERSCREVACLSMELQREVKE